MDPEILPEDLSTLDDEALAQYEERVTSRAAELRDTRSERELTDDEIREAEQLGDARRALRDEQATRDAQAEERAARAAAALASALGDDEAEDALEDGDEVPADDLDSDLDVESVPETELVPAAVTPQEAAVTAPAAPSRTRARRPASAAEVRARTPRTAAPRTSARSEWVSTPHAVPAVPDGYVFDGVPDIATAIAKRRAGFGNIPRGTRDMLPIATASKGIELSVSSDPVESLPTFTQIRADAASRLAAAAPTSGLVASGPFCTPLTPSYDFFRLAVPQSPVEDSLPVVNAPRGGIRFIPGTCDYLDAVGAIGDFAHDNDFDSDPKPCATVTCPNLEDAFVRAITQCVRFGNLQYRTFPEQVANFMEDVAVLFDMEKERYYLDAIDACSTVVTGCTPYGARRGLFYDWILAATAYRKRQRMARNATLAIYAPDWAVDMIKVDLAMDNESGENWVNVSDADVNSHLAANNLSPVWYADSATNTGQAMSDPQGAGLLNAWPATVHSYIFAPGNFVRLDGGTLDVGLVRDSALNRTNDLELFMEEWTGLACIGCESIHLISEPCPNGGAPEYDSLLECPCPPRASAEPPIG